MDNLVENYLITKLITIMAKGLTTLGYGNYTLNIKSTNKVMKPKNNA